MPSASATAIRATPPSDNRIAMPANRKTLGSRTAAVTLILLAFTTLVLALYREDVLMIALGLMLAAGLIAGGEVLRSWICLPLTMGLNYRAAGTIEAGPDLVRVPPRRRLGDEVPQCAGDHGEAEGIGHLSAPCN